jgi:hypothetical protein
MVINLYLVGRNDPLQLATEPDPTQSLGATYIIRLVFPYLPGGRHLMTVPGCHGVLVSDVNLLGMTAMEAKAQVQ